VINRVRISGYQSIDALDLTLAPFTVVVGPSSSGKSAFIRALRSVATYQRGSSFISAWRPKADGCTVALSLDAGNVGLYRNADSAKNRYSLRLHADPPEAPTVYTKLAGAVPADISRALGIAPESSLQLALQFDPPYLLAASPAEAHSTLAALTGVTTILAASKEANRRRLASLAVVKVLQREQEATEAILAAEPYATLDERLDAAETLRMRLDALQAAQHRHATIVGCNARLGGAAARARAARATLDLEPPSTDRLLDLQARHRALLDTRTAWITARTDVAARTAVLDRPEPDPGRLRFLVDKLTEVRRLVDALQNAQYTMGGWQDKIAALDDELDATEAEHAAALAALTVCPTCGRPYEEDSEHV
jgi:hypothetical protein